MKKTDSISDKFEKFSKQTVLNKFFLIVFILISKPLFSELVNMEAVELTISKIYQISDSDKIYSTPKQFQIEYDDKLLPIQIKENVENLSVYHKIDDRFFKLSNSKIDSTENTITFLTYFSGEYVVKARIEPYGISETGKFQSNENPILLIHGPLHSTQTWNVFKDELLNSNPDKLILTFEYQMNQSFNKSAELLSSELSELHKKYGDFNLEVITHSFGCNIIFSYISNEIIFNNDIDRCLYIVPPLGGSKFVEQKHINELLKFAKTKNIEISSVANSLIFHTVLGENLEILKPDNNEFETLFEKYGKHRCTKQQGGTAKKYIDKETIRGNKPFFSLTENVLPHIKELQNEIGDGLIDSDLNRTHRRISYYSMKPFPYNHLEIVRQPKIITKMIDFINLPHQFTISDFDEIVLNDLYKEAEYEISTHKWREFTTEYLYLYNENMLASLDKNAILFTFGDIDTYYAWSLQNKHNFRKDVAVVNLSILNLPKYIKILRDEMGIKLNINEDISKLGQDETSVFHPRKLAEDFEVDFSNMSGNEPLNITYKNGTYLTIADFVLLQIIKDNYQEKPIYFAPTGRKKGTIDDYLSNEGLVDRFILKKDVNKIHYEKLKLNVEENYSYKDFATKHKDFDVNTKRMYSNFGVSFVLLSNYHFHKKEYPEALKYMSRAIEFNSSFNRFSLKLNLSICYSKMEDNSFSEAFSYLEEAIKIDSSDNRLPDLIHSLSLKSESFDRGIVLLQQIKEFQNTKTIEILINELIEKRK